MSGRKPRNLNLETKYLDFPTKDACLEFSNGEGKNPPPEKYKEEASTTLNSNDIRKMDMGCGALCELCCDACGSL